MTWAPCQRVVKADVPPSFRVRGISAPVLLCWPGAFLNSAADYSVDFSGQLCCEETLTNAAFAVSGGVIGWSGKPTFTEAIATAWITWVAAGPQSVEVTAVTSGGRTLSAIIQITVLSSNALLAGQDQAVAPNVLTLPDGTRITTAAGNDLLAQ
ncbi:hypothetical protein HKD24_02810 [Gluconobacter sp. LMG 31484]|uniref:Uncharacterized protein n=1 Tax=Gluconobacter vitians TaxID=2728102 RepID=A0ABR9Y2R4_9PROT|nr:hypothetical protein [Gluconobacter vitians]MBF0858142.1 hypothetical protein [Gluconobacter vitians]